MGSPTYPHLHAAAIKAGKDPGKRPRVVVLGTGWGAHAFLSSIDATKYEVVVVSPRNFMLFTPMLAASAVGTVEYRSITEVSLTTLHAHALIALATYLCTYLPSRLG